MPTEVHIKGTGKSSDYRITFSGGIVDTRSLNIGDTIARGSGFGSVVDGEDIWIGEGDITVKNQSKRLIGEAPDIVVEIGGTSDRLTAGEEVTFRTGDEPENPDERTQFPELTRVRVEGMGGFTQATDYRIISSGDIQRGERLEFGDSVSNGEAVGQVVRGIDEWFVKQPFEIINLSKDPINPPPAILVTVGEEQFRVEPAESLTYEEDSGEVEEDEDREKDRGLTGLITSNPGLSLGVGVLAVVAVNSAASGD